MDNDFEALLEQIKAGRAQPSPRNEPRSNYDQFLEAILTGNHPAFCDLIWNGESYSISLMIHFQKSSQAIRPPGPEGEVYRRNAWRRFNRVKPDEQRLLHIRLTIKNGLPVNAEVTTRHGGGATVRNGETP